MQASLERLRERRESGDEGGFTLIELLIVIVILGILAAIVVFAVQNLTQQSSNAACQSDFKTTEVGTEAYKAQIGTYGTLAQLLTTATAPTSNQQVGPWLKDTPGSSKYQIIVGTSNLPGTEPTVAGTPPATTDGAGALGMAAKTYNGDVAYTANDGIIWIGTPGGTTSATATKWTSGSGAVLTNTSGTTWTGAGTLSSSSQTAQNACTSV